MTYRPDSKDYSRITKSIYARAKGRSHMVIRFAENMAKAITHADKAHRRGAAVLEVPAVFGAAMRSRVSAIFLARAAELAGA